MWKLLCWVGLHDWETLRKLRFPLVGMRCRRCEKIVKWHYDPFG